MRIVNARHGEKKRAKVSRVAAKECGPGQDLWGGGSAGPAVRPCGSSSDAGSCRTANKTIGISHGRAVKGTARWKSRKAGERALRYTFLYFSPEGSHGKQKQSKKRAPAEAKGPPILMVDGLKESVGHNWARFLAAVREPAPTENARPR
jgi:hypothetical protein